MEMASNIKKTEEKEKALSFGPFFVVRWSISQLMYNGPPWTLTDLRDHFMTQVPALSTNLSAKYITPNAHFKHLKAGALSATCASHEEPIEEILILMNIIPPSTGFVNCYRAYFSQPFVSARKLI